MLWRCGEPFVSFTAAPLAPSLLLRGLGMEKHKPVVHEHPVTLAPDPGSVGE